MLLYLVIILLGPINLCSQDKGLKPWCGSFSRVILLARISSIYLLGRWFFFLSSHEHEGIPSLVLIACCPTKWKTAVVRIIKVFAVPCVCDIPQRFVFLLNHFPLLSNDKSIQAITPNLFDLISKIWPCRRLNSLFRLVVHALTWFWTSVFTGIIFQFLLAEVLSSLSFGFIC